MDTQKANRYVLNFLADIEREGWSGQSSEYVRGVKETLRHINGLLTGSIQWAEKEGNK